MESDSLPGRMETNLVHLWKMKDNYDITAKAPITKQFKVKVRIRSIERMKPKVAINEVMEVMDLPDI